MGGAVLDWPRSVVVRRRSAGHQAGSSPLVPNCFEFLVRIRALTVMVRGLGLLRIWRRRRPGDQEPVRGCFARLRSKCVSTLLLPIRRLLPERCRLGSLRGGACRIRKNLPGLLFGERGRTL